MVQRYKKLSGLRLLNPTVGSLIRELQEELDEAKYCVEDLRNGSKKDKRVAEDLLKEAEKQHRKGKRILNKMLNIIPSGVLRPRVDGNRKA